MSFSSMGAPICSQSWRMCSSEVHCQKEKREEGGQLVAELGCRSTLTQCMSPRYNADMTLPPAPAP
jgi:hypothetical protein